MRFLLCSINSCKFVLFVLFVVKKKFLSLHSEKQALILKNKSKKVSDFCNK